MPNRHVQRPGYDRTTVSVGNWIGTFILTAIPLVGLILLFVWAFGGSAIPSKRNYARAMLILSLIGIVLSVIASLSFGSAFSALLSEYY